MKHLKEADHIEIIYEDVIGGYPMLCDDPEDEEIGNEGGSDGEEEEEPPGLNG